MRGERHRRTAFEHLLASLLHYRPPALGILAAVLPAGSQNQHAKECLAGVAWAAFLGEAARVLGGLWEIRPDGQYFWPCFRFGVATDALWRLEHNSMQRSQFERWPMQRLTPPLRRHSPGLQQMQSASTP